MAQFEVTGISKLNDVVNEIANVPDEVIYDILKAMGEEAIKYQKQSAKSMNIYDPDWSGTHVIDSFSLTKPSKKKNGIYSISVTFKGKRKRGNTETRNAEIAFVNEFGSDKRNIPSRPFISTANEKHGKEVYEAGEKVYDAWLQKIDN